MLHSKIVLIYAHYSYGLWIVSLCVKEGRKAENINSVIV